MTNPAINDIDLHNLTFQYWNQLVQNPSHLNQFIRENNIITIEYTSAYWNTVKSANKMNPKTPPTILAEQVVKDWSSTQELARQLVPVVLNMKDTIRNLQYQLESVQNALESILGYPIDDLNQVE